MRICTECNAQILKKDTFICSYCKAHFCPKHIGSYVDESNIAITKNSPLYCAEDYKLIYRASTPTVGESEKP